MPTGIADKIARQAAQAASKPYAHGGWVVSIADCVFYFAQHNRLLKLDERHTRRERRRECLRAGSADLAPGQAAEAG